MIVVSQVARLSLYKNKWWCWFGLYFIFFATTPLQNILLAIRNTWAFFFLFGLMPARAMAVASSLIPFFEVSSNVNTAWLRLDEEFIAVAAVVRLVKP